MNNQLNDLIKKELPEFFENFNKNYEGKFTNFSIEEKEELVEDSLLCHYPNDIEKRNIFRVKWNDILNEHLNPF